MRTWTYATLEEMQAMEFGVTGWTATIEGGEYEMLVDDETRKYGWAALLTDAEGSMIDWDRVEPKDARQMGLKAPRH